MSQNYIDRMLTPSVQAAQDRFFGHHQAGGTPEAGEAMGTKEMAFLQSRDSFYMATVNEKAWPYVQHRGGPKGFLKILGPDQIGFADYRGNRQLLSTGHVSQNKRLALFFMDYPNRRRLKMLGQGRVWSPAEQPELTERLRDPSTADRVERLFVIDVVSYDWNCPQYITPRFTAEEFVPTMGALHERIRELEAENMRLRGTATG